MTRPTPPRASTSASASPTRTIVVHGDGTRPSPYYLPTLAAFAADPYITAVIEGTVTSATAQVGEHEIVTTLLTVAVDRSAGRNSDASTVQVVEMGGIVPLRDVRGMFEGKEGQDPLTRADLNSLVDFQTDDATHTKVGDHVLLLAADNAAGPPDTFALAAKLDADPAGAGFRFGDGKAPNPGWAPAVNQSEAKVLMQNKSNVRTH